MCETSKFPARFLELLAYFRLFALESRYRVIKYHKLKNVYKTKELKKSATAEKISVVRREGNRDVNRTLQFYNLDAIISVGYRNSGGTVLNES